MIKDKLLAWIGGAASLGLAAALAFVWITKGAEVRALTLANSNLANDLSQCRINNSRLEGALSAQNARIWQQEAQGERRLAKLADVMSDAAEASREARRASERILRARPAGDLCLAADRLILEEAGQ